MAEPEFSRIVEQLIRRSVEEDDPGLEVKALDGRGGDGGIDLDAVVAKTGQLVAIYQLKFFPEGFSGGWASARKPQIRRSYDAALAHNPPVWYLVAPRNFTAKERSFIQSLRGKSQSPRIRYIGENELDALTVRFGDIEEWAERNPLRKALEITGRQSAALALDKDLTTELQALKAKVKNRSDYWDIDFSRVGDVITETLVAQRPDAQEREPLSLTLTTDFSDATELGAAFKKSLEYGVTAPIVLPESVVKKFEKHGPDWFSGSYSGGTFELHPAPRVLEVPTTINLIAASGRVLAQRNGVRCTTIGGYRGGQLTIELDDNIEITFMFDRDSAKNGRVHVTSDLTDLSGSSAKRSLRFLSALSAAATMHFSIDGLSSEGAVEGEEIEPNPYQVELADDLAFIEEKLNTTLRYPANAGSQIDRIQTRVVRRLLEGEVSLMPNVKGMNFVLDGTRDPGIELLLEKGGQIRSSTELWTLTLFGQTVTIDDVSMLMPDAIVESGKEHLLALLDGTGQGRKVSVIPSDGVKGVLIWSPMRFGDRKDFAPKRWELTGLKEHKQLRA